MATRLLDVVAHQLKPGLYLSDGERLYRILAVLGTDVELENCGDPEGLPQWLPVGTVVREMRLVRPEP